MKRPRVSLATIGFVILVLAVDFGMLRWGFSSDVDERALAVCFFPMVDVLLVALYRSARRGSLPSPSRTAFLSGGAIATLLFVSVVFAAPAAAFQPLAAVGRPIFRATLAFLTRAFGNGIMQSGGVRLILGLTFEFGMPLLYFNLPPLFVALGCRWLVHRRKSRWGSVATPVVRPALQAS